MKKFMTMMLGLGLILGTASFAFGEEPMKDTTKTGKMKTKKSKTKKSKTDTTTTTSTTGK